MSTWNYRLASKDNRYGKRFVKEFGILEVYYNDNGEAESIGDFKDPNDWEDIEDLQITLKHMLEASYKPVFCHTSSDGTITYLEDNNCG